MTDSRAVRLAVAYLRGSQQPNGSFPGLASPDLLDFRHARQHPTIFLSALILNCLHDIPGTAAIRSRCADFLLSERSPNWTWNYWQRTSDLAIARPYPDDLDDTACVLSALHHHKPKLIDGAVLAHIAQSLIACEASPGGPYTTWLVNLTSLPDWFDVDLAVNANIGYLLLLLGVEVSGLERYVTNALLGDKLTSSYYPGQIPLIYFLSRWYKGTALARLRKLVLQALRDGSQDDNPLFLSLLVTAGCHLNISRRTLATAVKKLLGQQHDGHWVARALYYEPPINGQQYYAGSAALTTAFALEALKTFADASQPTKPKINNAITTREAVARQAIKIPGLELRTQYQQAATKLIELDHDQQITGLATITAQACGRKPPARLTTALNLANLHGWLAYTIYDNIWDDEDSVAQLGVANFAMREAEQQFHLALPDHIDFQQLVQQTLLGVDSANTWEALHARAKSDNGSLCLPALPDYGDNWQLAERSWGHVLAAQGILLAVGYKLSGLEQRALQGFFRHFLIARQLNDDAHDWESDLAKGQLSAVVTLLLKQQQISASLELSGAWESLSLAFWQTTILDVVDIINQHLRAAQIALENCPFTDTSQYQSWLDKLWAVTAQVTAKRQEAQLFMQTYGAGQLQ